MLKHVLNHLFNHCVCLYVDGLLIVGVGCEVWIEYWSFWWKMSMMVKTWWYKLMFSFILMLLWSMLTVGEVFTTILDQLGFLEIFCVSSWEGIHLWVHGFPCHVLLSWRDVCCAEQHVLFCTFWVFGVVSEHPQVFLLVCLDVVLTNSVVGTSFKLD